MRYFTDQLGRELVMADLPRRIVSLVPSQTELLFDLGLDECVVGITRYCVHPEAKTRHKAVIGGTKNPDLEAIRALNPDLIIGNKEENRQEDIEALQGEFTVWMSDVNSLADALAMIKELGRLVGKEDSANWMADLIEARFSELTHSPPETSQSPRVAYLIWRKPWMVAGKGTFIHDVLHRAGYQNAFETHTRYPECTADSLRSAQLDLILLSTEPYPFQEKHLQEVQALCPKASLRLVDGELFSWYGSRLLRTPRYLQSLLAKPGAPS